MSTEAKIAVDKVYRVAFKFIRWHLAQCLEKPLSQEIFLRYPFHVFIH